MSKVFLNRERHNRDLLYFVIFFLGVWKLGICTSYISRATEHFGGNLGKPLSISCCPLSMWHFSNSIPIFTPSRIYFIHPWMVL